MSMFSTFSTSYKKLPRAGRWGLWLVVVVVGYFGVIEPAVDWSTSKAAEAEKLQKSLIARTRLSEDAGSSAKTVERGIVGLGSPKVPHSSVADPMGFLSQKTAEIAQKHGITVKRRTRRTNSPVANFEWNGSKVERVALELVVECDTERFVALLKDLEASPDITEVSSVRMNKVSEPGFSLSDSTTMQITLVPEMWVLPRGGGGDSPAPTTPEADPLTSPPLSDGATQ